MSNKGPDPKLAPSTHLSSLSSGPGERRSPRQERARITVIAILEAAEELLCVKGYASTTTNSIAHRAGVSIGSLYQYFPNKDAIFRELLTIHHRELEPIHRQALAHLTEGQPVSRVLGDVLQGTLAIRQRNPRLMTAIHEELGGLTKPRSESADPPVQESWNVLAQILAARNDIAKDHLAERSWLALTIMENVGRGLVHHRMPDLDQEALLGMTRDLCASILVGEK